MRYLNLTILSLCFSMGALAQPYINERIELEAVRDQSVTDIWEAPNGDLWIGTEGGVVHRNYQTFEYTFHPVDSAFDVQNGRYEYAEIERIRILDGQPWALTEGFGAYYYDGTQWNEVGQNIGLPSNEINDVAIDDQKNIWIAEEKVIGQLIGDSLVIHRPFGYESPTEALLFDKGRLYANRHNSIIYYEAGQWSTLGQAPSRTHRLNNISIDPSENIILSHKGSYYYALKYDGANWDSLFFGGFGHHYTVNEEGLYLMHVSENILYKYDGAGWDTIQQMRLGDRHIMSFAASSNGGFIAGMDYWGDPGVIQFGMAEHHYSELDINDISAGFSGGGQLFQNELATDSSGSVYGNFTPKYIKAPLVKCASLWISGLIDKEPRVSANTFAERGRDFMSGPVSERYDFQYLEKYDRVWKVDKQQIENHINNVFSPTYKIPEVIKNWPAHGRKAYEEKNLAPFVDYNNNGIYEPNLGDHPQIKGDQAVYFIFNDDRGFDDETDWYGLGVEVHAMAYAYSGESQALNNSIFINYKLINRSGKTIENLKTSTWTDFQIGQALDDAVGCDSALGLVYTYNADNDDEGYFGKNPPVAGYLFLSDSLTGTMNYYDVDAPNSRPSTYYDYTRLMNQRWPNGTALYIENPSGPLNTNNGDGYVPGNHDLPITHYHWNDQVNWYQSPMTDNDEFRNLGSFRTITLKNGESHCFELAFLHAPGQGDQLASLEELKSRAREIKKLYRQNTEDQSCLVTKGAYRQTSESPVSVYPNPANHQLFIELGDGAQLQASTVFTISGQKVLEFEREKILNLTSLPAGAYLLRCTTNRGVYSFKILKR